MPTIFLDDIGISYFDKKTETVVFNHFSHTFPSNKINVILGKSGCGKTTILKAIAGLKIYDGTIYYDGKDYDDVPTNKRNLSLVNQDYSLYSHLTVFDNIAFPLKVIGCSAKEIKDRVNEIA